MDLKDQLVKAGLVSAKQARQVAHRERVEHKQSGEDSGRSEAEARAQEARRQREAQRERDRRLAQEQQAGRAESERQIHERERQRAQVDAALRDGRIERWQGARTYYFVDGSRIESLSVSDDAARRLEEGSVAIVRGQASATSYTLLHAPHAQRLREFAPERVVTLHLPRT